MGDQRKTKKPSSRSPLEAAADSQPGRLFVDSAWSADRSARWRWGGCGRRPRVVGWTSRFSGDRAAMSRSRASFCLAAGTHDTRVWKSPGMAFVWNWPPDLLLGRLDAKAESHIGATPPCCRDVQAVRSATEQCSSPVEDVADFPHQRLRRKRLLQEGAALVESTVASHGIVGIPGHVKHFEPGSQAP
jgi:hypothetical protein